MVVASLLGREVSFSGSFATGSSSEVFASWPGEGVVSSLPVFVPSTSGLEVGLSCSGADVVVCRSKADAVLSWIGERVVISCSASLVVFSSLVIEVDPP